MNYVKYVTDNPYRLLQISSCTSPKELRKAADIAIKKIQVGLPFETGMETLFGSESLIHCSETAKLVANDPKQRSVYRLFWPFLYEKPQGANGTPEDMQKIIDRYSERDIFYVTQLCFLKRWYSFLSQPTHENARLALMDFSTLYEDAACDAYLIELLEREGADASSLPPAQKEVIVHLLGTICRQSAQDWEEGKIEQGCELASAVCSSFFDQDAVHAALRPVILAGDSEMAKIRDSMPHFGEWTPPQGTHAATDAANLKRLAQAVSNRAAVTGLWLETSDKRINQVANAVRNYAIDIANKNNDWNGCRVLLKKVEALPLPDEWTEKLRDDFKTLRENELGAERERLYKVIQPITKAPELHTINGIGTKLYGKTPFDVSKGAYLSTLYFVFILVPLFPIARYLVRDAPNGGWYFDGKTSWSKGNKVHAWLVILVCCGLAGRLKFSSNSTPDYSSFYASSAPATQPILPSVSPETLPVVAPTVTSATGVSTAHKNQLRQQEKQLTQRIKAENAKLSSEQKNINHTKQALKEVKAMLDEMLYRLKNTQTDINAERLVLDQQQTAEVFNFNAKVDKYNTDNADYNKVVQEYENQRHGLNADVDAYNAHTRRVNKDVARLRKVVQALQNLGE